MDLKEFNEKIGWAFEAGADEDERLPVWVRNLYKNIVKSCLPEVGTLKNASSDDFSALGFAFGAGIQCQDIIQEFAPLLASAMGIKFTEADSDELETEFSELEFLKKRAEEKLVAATREEKKTYYDSVADGQTPLIDEQGQPQGAKTNTPLEFLMIMSWPVIEENCRTRRQLYEKLQPMCKIFNIELGNYKRVEKIFERIDFTPAKPGRPKKQ